MPTCSRKFFMVQIFFKQKYSPFNKIVYYWVLGTTIYVIRIYFIFYENVYTIKALTDLFKILAGISMYIMYSLYESIIIHIMYAHMRKYYFKVWRERGLFF